MAETDGCWKPLSKTSWKYDYSKAKPKAMRSGTYGGYLNARDDPGWVRVPIAEYQDWMDAYSEKEFAKEMAKSRGRRFVKRRVRYYTCSRPCCGRRATVSIYTDMEGVRKPSKDVRACAYCGVAWSVTSGKVICESHTEVCETSPEDAAWAALPAPALKPF
jgi:hypothetical protein|tara:strand:- start:22 stop:504 length:483 start_codon:yes stop_codon:yes gene_type:complete